jgi:hypothetical protein
MHGDEYEDDEPVSFLVLSRGGLAPLFDEGEDYVYFDLAEESRVEAAYTARRALRCAGVRIGADQLVDIDEDRLVAAVVWAELPPGNRPELPAFLVAAQGANRDERRCRVCGCTDDFACEGGCIWVDGDLCSHCVSLTPLEVLEICRLVDPAERSRYGIEPVASTWDLGYLLASRRLAPGAYRVMAFDRRTGRCGERHDIGGLVIHLDGTWTSPRLAGDAAR